MKKLFAVLAILLAIGTTSVFAKGKSLAIGAQAGFPLGGALTFKVPSAPCVFAFDFSANGDAFNLGLTADWWLANPKIEGTWGYYYGVGVYGGLWGVGGNGVFAVAPRALIGTNVFLLDNFLELYLQGGWEPTFVFGNGFDPHFATFFGNFGFRFWL